MLHVCIVISFFIIFLKILIVVSACLSSRKWYPNFTNLNLTLALLYTTKLAHIISFIQLHLSQS